MLARLRANRDLTLSLLFLALSAALWFTPTGFENRIDATALRARARVVSVDNDRVLHFGIIKTGWQTLTMKLLDGPFKGQTVEGDNLLTGKLELDKIFVPGDEALAVITTTPDGRISRVNPQDHYRLDKELLLLALFAGLLVLYAGATGAKALLSFVFTGLAIWKLLVPAMLHDYDPIWVTLGLVTLLISAVIFLVGGLSRKGLVAFCGAMLGLLTTCVLSLALAPGFHLNGAVRPFAETLLYTGFAHLNLTRIFLSGIFLASAGAVMDLAMDVAASQNEVLCKKPDLHFREALRSGFAVGRAVTGTMTTTLLLAYSGGYMTLLMVFMAQGTPVANLFNLTYVAAEIFNTMVGSLGLVATAPLTALIGAFVFTRRRAC
ncbi:YibE/F family protein [Desulfovibrio sp. X2]|uniref:YibE/F family protein n=1 Tax=Desulfovibrio sp. X2 TaxID=941449 RepID=UPI000358C97D|nr:YibE/F family protein [Desulfovibrio sp. X2]EPR39798.1 YibE/F family protein [Desulfovibrio sp. X2]